MAIFKKKILSSSGSGEQGATPVPNIPAPSETAVADHQGERAATEADGSIAAETRNTGSGRRSKGWPILKHVQGEPGTDAPEEAVADNKDQPSAGI